MLTSSSHSFFSMLDIFSSVNVLKLKCSSTWDCSWRFAVCLFLLNRKMVCKSPNNKKVSYWSQISFQKQPPDVLHKKNVLKNLTKLTEKYLCKILFLNNVAGIWQETLAQVFYCGFCEIIKNNFFREHLWAIASVTSLEI